MLKVLEAFVNKHPENDYWGTFQLYLSLLSFVLLQGNLILQKLNQLFA